ncbi:hypothetical protein C0991_008392 [Blastosporella zonata]|nr:hypothetical protein C0991_008392 [Blastosporella zonata]
MPELATEIQDDENVLEQNQVNDIRPTDPFTDDLKQPYVMVLGANDPRLKKERIFKRPFLSDLRPGDLFMDDPKETDVIIPVIGITGFINILLGQDDLAPVGHTLNSHTHQIQHIAYPHPHIPGSRVVLVDTPGFDHSTVEDSEILRRIAVWLAQSYDANMKLAGVIYLHEIFQRNMPPVQRNLGTFNKLCGPSATRNIVLATTKWSDIPENIGEERETSLRENHWKDMLDRGYVMLRYEGTQASAQIIVDQILAQEPLDAVQIQKELVDLNKVLAETEAGLSLYCSLNELLETQKKTTARLRAHEGTAHPDLRRVMFDTDSKIRSILRQIKGLNYPLLSKRIKHCLEFVCTQSTVGNQLLIFL